MSDPQGSPIVQARLPESLSAAGRVARKACRNLVHPNLAMLEPLFSSAEATLDQLPVETPFSAGERPHGAPVVQNISRDHSAPCPGALSEKSRRWPAMITVGRVRRSRRVRVAAHETSLNRHHGVVAKYSCSQAQGSLAPIN